MLYAALTSFLSCEKEAVSFGIGVPSEYETGINL
jgi:hypothetical protein